MEPLQPLHLSGRALWGSYRRLLHHARPYLGRLIPGLLCGFLFAGSQVGSLPLMKSLFGFLGYEQARLGDVLMIAAVLLSIVVVRGVGEYFGSYLVQWVGNRVVMDLRIRAFTHLQNLSVAYFDRNKTGEIMSRTINDTSLLEWAISSILLDLTREPFLFVGAVAYMCWLDWVLAVLTLAVFPLCLVPLVLFGRKVRRAGREGQERLAEILAVMQEAVGGIRVVKAFGMERHEEERFSTQCRQFFGRIMRVVRAKSLIEPIIVFFSAIGLVVALAYAKAHRMSLEEFVTFAIALVIMYSPVRRLSRVHLVIQHASAAADRIFELLDTESSVREKPAAIELKEPAREIRFEDVAFDYGSGAVLDGISLTVRAGERVAIVGGSGAGKTTLINLLPRFFDPTRGRIQVNGNDLRDLTLASLRRQVGLVTQETFLFNDSVLNNIRYGTPGASRAEVEAAARNAHAAEFIERMDQGYETTVGERGVRLSGGQRQRLAIARAILRNPPILILDEATSALDTEAERVVQEAIDAVMTGRTVFAVAHRLSTIAHFDRIVVLDRGRIAETGTHDELVARDGIYRKLFTMQFDRVEGGTTA